MNSDRIVWLDDFNQEAIYRFEKAIIIAHETYSFAQSAPLLAAAGEIIARNAESTDDGSIGYPSRLFVKRVGTRKLLGADDLLERYGFTTIVPEELSLVEQIRYFVHADIVLSPHGANSANSHYMRPGSVLIETFGKGYINPWSPEIIKLKGAYYLYCSETPYFGCSSREPVEDYHVDSTILELLINAAIKLTD